MLRRPSALSDLLAGRAEPTRRAWTISTSRGGPSAVSPLARASTRVSPSLEIDAGTRSRPGVTSRTARLSTCPATLGGSRRASLEPRAWTYLVVREVVLSVVARLAEALAPQRGLRGQGLRASSDAPGTASEVFSSAPQGAATIVTARVSTCPVATRTFPARESRDSCLERPHSAGSRVCSRRASHGGPCSSRTSPSGTGLARTSEPGDVESCLGARVAEDKPDRIAVVREGSTSSPRGTRRPETASFAFRRRCCRRAARRDLAVALVDMLQDFDPFVARLAETRDHSPMPFAGPCRSSLSVRSPWAFAGAVLGESPTSNSGSRYPKACEPAVLLVRKQGEMTPRARRRLPLPSLRMPVARRPCRRETSLRMVPGRACFCPANDSELSCGRRPQPRAPPSSSGLPDGGAR